MSKTMVNAQANARGENNAMQPCSPEGKPEKDRHARLKEYRNWTDCTKVHPREECNTVKSLSEVLKDHVQRC